MAPANVELIESARIELREAIAWYADESPETAERFEHLIDRVFREIAESPSRWPVYRRGVRRRVMRGFPYAVYYMDILAGVRIIAVMHTSRRPDYWKDRID